MYNGAMRAAYDCVNPHCKGWRWVDDAKRRKETACSLCGTLFHADAVRSWPPLEASAKGKGRGRGGGKGGGGEGGKGQGHHQVQGGKGGAGAVAAAGAGGPRPIGLQAQERYHLQGGVWGGQGEGAGKPKGAAQTPRRQPTSQVALVEDRLAKLVAIMGDDHPYVQDQRRVLEEARKEEEARLSPADKAARLRAEL